MTSRDRVNTYIIWCILNLVIPLSPLALKITISFFGSAEILKVDIFDSVELVFYNLFICITILNMLSGKESCIEIILKYAFITICLVDLVVLFLIYTNAANDRCRQYAKILTFLVPVFALVYKFRCISDEQGGVK